MAKLLIAYYSKSGNTKKMASLVEEGARDAGASVQVSEAEEVSIDALPNYDAIILGSPTYYGDMAAPMKKFLDDNGVKYVTISHSRAYTALEIAEMAHIPGKDLAKTVMVKLDGRTAMAVVRA